MKLLTSLFIGFALLFVDTSLPSDAQIIPDSTIPTKSKVYKNNNSIDITKGTKKGNNLFHSFKRFSVKSDEIVNFKQNNSDYVFTRITSPSRSLINGKINIVGKAQLIFINPSGITFGKNGKIFSNHPVTFSTANRIKFKDGVFDSSNKFTNINKLSKFDTFELKFNTPQSIEFIGNGFTNILKSPETVPFTSFLTETILNPQRFSFAPKTILAGNTINLNGALLNSDGQLKLISLKKGSLKYNFDRHELVNAKLADINLSNRSQIESAGMPFQGIQLTARNISLANSSSIIGTNLGGNSTQNIELDANQLKLSGITDLKSSGINSPSPEFLFSNTFDSSIRAQNITGKGIGITIKSKDIFLEKFSSIAIIDESLGASGDLNIAASNIDINGQPPLPSLPTAISLQNIQGNIGDLNIKSKNLTISNGGFLTSTGLSTKNQRFNGGNINLAVDKINVTGETLLDINNLPVSSSIATSTEQSGSAGSINIKSNSIRLSDHGVISTNSIGFSKSGNINIDTENLSIIGTDKFDTNQTGIYARSILTDTFFDPNQLFLGESGDINIISRNTSISDLGQIAVSNLGIGDAGSISINSKDLRLINKGSIVATTNGGDGGFINIFSGIQVLDGGVISSSSKGIGIGGNININAKVIAAKNDSIISADSENNQAGNVDIKANTFIANDINISASSRFGSNFDGEISITQKGNELRLLENIPPVDNSVAAVTTQCTNKGEITNHGSGINPLNLSETQRKALDLKQRLELASQFTYLDHKTGERKPFKRWLGIQRKDDGNLEFVFSPEQSKTLQKMLLSLDNVCLIKS